MTVGALDARLRLNKVGVCREIEKGVVDRGGLSSGEAAALRFSGGLGLVERRPNSSPPEAARLRRSSSETISAVLAVLRFVSWLRPTTVP